MTVCLAMIVRDEAETIGRCLDAARPHIDRWVIVDTGSTDATRDLVRQHLDGVPGELHEREWRGFGPNRTELAQVAKGSGDYLMLLDADTVVEWAQPLPGLTADCYEAPVLQGQLRYTLPFLVSTRRDWEWRGVAHCYLHAEGGFTVEVLDGVTVHDRGQTTTAKIERDLDLLAAEHARHPLDARTAFYLAQTYRNLGRVQEAIAMYRVRAALVGWDEERFVAQFHLGRMLVEHVSFAEGAPELLKAWQMRPGRAEPLMALSRSARNVAAKIPLPYADRLFVQSDDYAAAAAPSKWDEWRARYPNLTVAEQQAAYDAAFDEDRNQRRFDARTLQALLERIGEPVSVVELGGWDGELAAEVFAATNGQVKTWRNYEISPKAVAATVCDDPRYKAVVPKRFYWQTRRRGDVFVASHVIEHLSLDHVRRTLDATDCRYVFLQAPLEAGPTDWAGYDGGHVLEVGWDGLDAELSARGFAPMPELARDTVRCYAKEAATCR